MGSLLADLRDGVTGPTWQDFGRILPIFVPGADVTKVEYFRDGHVGFRGRAPMGRDRVYVVGSMDGHGARREDGRHRVRMGVGKYRDEGDANFYSRPFMGWIEPNPAGLVAWVAGILLVEDPHSPRRAHSTELA